MENLIVVLSLFGIILFLLRSMKCILSALPGNGTNKGKDDGRLG